MEGLRISDQTAGLEDPSPNYLTPSEVANLGLACTGVDVQISRDARLYGASRISIGNHVRIDAFTLISAGESVTIGNYVHIAPFCSLSGQGRIIMEDFSGLSGRVSIYTSSDDYSGRTMTNPTVPAEFKDVKNAQIHIGRHAIIGAGAVLLPGASIGEGSAVGALSLVSTRLPEWKVFTGNPLRLVGRRRRDLLDLTHHLLDGASPGSPDQAEDVEGLLSE
jgi:dTDP-4-amino-4,6-dideoxy-D-glucose acyltransferase